MILTPNLNRFVASGYRQDCRKTLPGVSDTLSGQGTDGGMGRSRSQDIQVVG
jgi:hypothetical protein